MEFLLYPIVFYLLLLAFKYFITFQQLMKIRLKVPRYQVVSGNSVPAYLKDLFQTPIKALNASEFRPVSYLEVEPTTKLGAAKQWEILLYNKALKTYAKVAIRFPIESFHLFNVELLTVLPDQTLLYTMNGISDAILGDLPNTILQDPYSGRFSVQLQIHQDKLNQLSTIAAVPIVPPQSFAKVLEKLGQQYLMQLLDRKQITKNRDSEDFCPNWQFVLKFLHKLSQHNKKYAKLSAQLQRQAKTESSLQVEIPVELEAEAFRRMEQLQQGSGETRNSKLGILLVSFALFLIAYAQIFPVEKLLIFVIALLLHEGGHLFAMKVFGYQNTALLFVPFLGALATARKTDATLTQKFWVSLAGPLPGLIIGIGLAIAAQNQSYPEWVSEAGWIFISLNLFNLLPVYPLDGGQIADLLVFSRSPYLGIVFKVFGVLLLLLLGLGNSLLWMFALLISLTIPFSFRSDKMTAKIRREVSSLSSKRNDDILIFILQKIKQLGYGNLLFSKRYVLAKGLRDRHQEAKAKGTTRLFLSAFYLMSLLGGIAGATYAYIPGLGTVLTHLADSRTAQQRQVDQATEAIRINPNDTKAYQTRARALLRLGDRQAALANYDQLIRLDPNNPSHYMARAGIQQSLEDYQGAIREYDRLLKIKPDYLPAYQLRADVRLSMGDYQAALQEYSKLIQLGDRRAHIKRGRVRMQLKDYKGAIAEVNPLIQQAPNEFPEAYDLRSQAKRKLGDEQGANIDQEKARMLYQLHDQEDRLLSEEE